MRKIHTNGIVTGRDVQQLSPYEKWPEHVQQVLLVVGRAMCSGRLHPENLIALPVGLGAIVPDHIVTITHVRGSALGRRKGRYQIEIEGPRCSGRWTFSSGQLERLARAAVLANAH